MNEKQRGICNRGDGSGEKSEKKTKGKGKGSEKVTKKMGKRKE